MNFDLRQIDSSIGVNEFEYSTMTYLELVNKLRKGIFWLHSLVGVMNQNPLTYAWSVCVCVYNINLYVFNVLLRFIEMGLRVTSPDFLPNL